MVGQPLRTSPVSGCAAGLAAVGPLPVAGPGGPQDRAVIGLNKIPHTIHLERASTTDETTWSPSRSVSMPYLSPWRSGRPRIRPHRGGGLGYVFTTEDSFTGVDLDHSVDPATGAILPWAQTILETLVSYTQYSVSGTGAHCIVSGRLPSGKRQVGDLQMWDQARFFAMTGWLVPGTPPTIAPRQDALTLVWTTHQARPPDAPRAPIVQVSPPPSDTDLLAKAHAATNGPKFADLRATGSATCMTRPARPTWGCVRCCASGRRTPRKSPGCSRRRASTGTRSGKRADYRQRTIAAALAHCTNFYAPVRTTRAAFPPLATRPRPQGVVHTEEHAMSLLSCQYHRTRRDVAL